MRTVAFGGVRIGARLVRPVQLDWLDLPLAVLVLRGRDLAALDRSQDRRLVEAAGRGGRREAVGHGVRTVAFAGARTVAPKRLIFGARVAAAALQGCQQGISDFDARRVPL